MISLSHTPAVPSPSWLFMTLLVLGTVLPFDMEAGWFSPLAAYFTRLGGRTEATEWSQEAMTLEKLGTEGVSIPTLITRAWQCGLLPNVGLLYISNFTVIKLVNGSSSTWVQQTQQNPPTRKSFSPAWWTCGRSGSRLIPLHPSGFLQWAPMVLLGS